MSPYDLAYEYVMHTNECIYLTGKAGTGKTTFLHRLQRECPKQIVVCAPTGVAAINAEGVTIHSLFQLPPQVFLPTDQSYRKLFSEMRLREQKLRLLRNLELLVIDEISMVRADLLDAIDAVLRHVRHRPNLPFGGVQMLFIGDLYQLSPVAREEDWYLMRPYYNGPYFFQAQIFRQISPVYIELDHVYRQSNVEFVDLLNSVRTNTLTPDGLAMLNARYNPDYRDKSAILLSTHNRKVDAINERELNAIDKPVFRYQATIKNTFPDSMYPMDTELVLKVGARVMFIKNDSAPEKAYYNGKLGTVVSLTDDAIFVLCNGENQPIKVHLETWENLRYVNDSVHSDEIRTEVAGTFTHFPLRLAWAVTIHKAQGLTFDRVVIDAEDAFAAGQVYVALSRCRSLDGITLLSRIPSAALTNAREVLQFTGNQPSLSDVEQRLTPAELNYFRAMLCDVYDFTNVRHQLEHLRRVVADAGSFNQPATDTFLNELLDNVMDWQRVSESFQNQLRAILNVANPDYEYLGRRLSDAKGYFDMRLGTLADKMLQSPAFTDDKEDAKDYQRLIEEAYVDLKRKQHIMAGMDKHASIRRYFELRQSFAAPRVKIAVKGEERKISKDDSRNPLLLQQLQQLRRELSQQTEQPAYVYASTEALIEISNYLPINRHQLLTVKGFGPKRYALWGEQILALVRSYADVPDKQRFSSALLTLKGCFDGKDIHTQSVERNLSEDTILRDVVYLVREEMLSPDRLSAADRGAVAESLSARKE